MHVANQNQRLMIIRLSGLDFYLLFGKREVSMVSLVLYLILEQKVIC